MHNPHLEVITLEGMNIRTIYQVFLDAFTDYYVEFDKRPEFHFELWLSVGVDFSLSYGVKADGVLVAFLLHIPRGGMVMNFATGVRKEFQGKGLTGLMYERVLKELPGINISRFQLEVITENLKGISAYKKAGLKIERTLRSWKGSSENFSDFPGQHAIRTVTFTQEHEELTPYAHAFLQDNESVMRRSGMHELHELRVDGDLLSYAVWNPWKMNLVQLGGKHRGAIEGLLRRMKLSGEEFGMVNVDERNHLINNFFQEKGLKNYLSQYEMALSR